MEYILITNPVLLLMLAFLGKHFVVDFLLQGPYQYLNKGTYFHPGGILHSGLHAVATGAMLYWWLGLSFEAMWVFAAIEFFVHYHIDWAKVKINLATGWRANTSEYYWWLLGLDQLLHGITYIYLCEYLAPYLRQSANILTL